MWEHFTLADGLPDLKIECLFVDSQGNLWVGTRERGVARFDGDRFTTFTARDGLAGDSVLVQLIERNQGTCNLLEFLEARLVQLALEQTSNTQSRAARQLGIPRKRLERRARKYNRRTEL